MQRPGSDDWRLCYPGPGYVAGTPNPKCPTAEFFIVNQRDASSDGVVDWLQGCVRGERRADARRMPAHAPPPAQHRL